MKLNIIIADDEYFIRKRLVKTVRERFDFIDQIYEAENGDELWQRINEVRPDLIISDIRMPGMDGLEVLKLLKENFMDTKLIILSGYNEFEYAKTAVKYSAFDYILKPIAEEELIPSVNRAYKSIMEDKKSDYKYKLGLFLEYIQNDLPTESFFRAMDDSVCNPYLLQIYKKKITEEIKSIFFFFKRSKAEYLWIKEDEDTYTILMYHSVPESETIFKFMEYINQLYTEDFYFLVYSELNKNTSLCFTYQNLKEKLKLRFNHTNSQTVSVDINEHSDSILSSSVKNLISRNYKNVRFSIEDISKELGLNSSYIGSIFKKENDISIIKYLNSIRLNKARELLKSSDKKMADIALECGFSDVYYFSKKYKSFFGYPPGDERR